ncbi:MAG: glycosyltransferase family 2 protein [Gemmatimonadetes bacterium]|nr:glycosyltransferase family 2 protein [Gemmatimonadota bacterium]
MPASVRVSVITIFLNGEKFIEEAIRSVFAQTYHDWELLLVDDGSTDGSSEIARRSATEHPERVRYLEHAGHANRGMSASRNLGLRHARGEFIALLDADDVYLPQKLAEQVALLDRHPEAAMLYGRTRYWFSWTGDPQDQERDFLTAASPYLDTLVPPPVELAAHIRHEIYFPCTCSVLFRREVLESVGGFEEAFRASYEDMVVYSKIFLRHPVFVADRCWDYYRQHPDSSWAVAVKAGAYVGGSPNAVRGMYLTWLHGYLEREPIHAPEVRRLVRLHLLPYRYPRLYRVFRALRTSVRGLRALLSMPSRSLLATRSAARHAPQPTAD